MIKKVFSLFSLVVLMTALAFTTACSKKEASSAGSDKKNVVVTTSFLADMVEQIAGDSVNIDMIIPAGEDPHLYVAKPDDLTKIQKSDLLLYHGIHFEGKMVEALEKKGTAVTKNFKDDEIGVMEEDGEKIKDPHFWFNLDLYKKAVDVANEELGKLVPEKKDEYSKKAEAYKAELDKLNEENKKLLSEIPKENRYLVTPHDAFNYFSRAYDIEVVAPQGVSTDSELANKDIDKTAQFIVDHKIKAIFAESTTNPERMNKLKEIVKSKGFDVKVVSGEDKELFSDSLAPKGSKGDTFIDMYRHNVHLMNENLK